MAILPTYQQVGLWAPIALVLLRILQGLSAGGEYTTSIVFLAEHAPANRRGLVTIWGLWGSVLGMLLGSAAGTLLSSSLSATQMHNWGWRVPFALGLLLALTGLALRHNLHSETPPTTASRPLQDLARYRGAVLRVLLLNVASSVAFYTAFVYVITYIQTEAGQSESVALALNTRVMGLLLIFYPIAAWISDRLGRRPLLITGSLFLLLAGLPIFELLHSGNPAWITRGEVLMMLAVALLAGAKNPANVELMPEAVRCTGLALAFNVAEGYLGGTTPLIASWLVSSSGNPLLPGYWVALAGAITLITALWFTPESFRLPLQRL
jgi:MHS family proline/betaine transporter-like MFS transporter